MPFRHWGFPVQASKEQFSRVSRNRWKTAFPSASWIQPGKRWYPETILKRRLGNLRALHTKLRVSLLSSSSVKCVSQIFTLDWDLSLNFPHCTTDAGNESRTKPEILADIKQMLSCYLPGSNQSNLQLKDTVLHGVVSGDNSSPLLRWPVLSSSCKEG